MYSVEKAGNPKLVRSKSYTEYCE